MKVLIHSVIISSFHYFCKKKINYRNEASSAFLFSFSNILAHQNFQCGDYIRSHIYIFLIIPHAILVIHLGFIYLDQKHTGFLYALGLATCFICKCYAAHSPQSQRMFTFSEGGFFWSILELVSLVYRALEINSGTKVLLQQWSLWAAMRNNQEMKTI